MDSSTIHRQTEVAQLLALLQSPKERLSIVAVSGPGGVGKTYLLDHVLSTIDVEGGRFLRLSVDGSNKQTRGEFFSLIEGQLLPRSLPAPAEPRTDYFPQVRRIAEIHRQLIDEVARELTKSGAPQATKDAAVALLRAGHVLNKLIPRTRAYVDLASLNASDQQVRDSLDAAWTLLEHVRALSDATTLPGPIARLLGVTLRNRVRRDLHNVVADALVSDLSAALVGYQGRDVGKLMHPRISGVDRLLLVLDDFEALSPVLGEFLVAALVPRLSDARFQTVMVILCRDDLDAMHPGWAQHCKRYVRAQVRLRPFDRETAFAMLASANVPEHRQAELFRATQGFPFLLSLLVEEAGAENALFLRKFFDRTTRWMSVEEAVWFVKVCYLDAVNEDTLRRFFPEEEVGRVQSWFERESSIRDPAAPDFRVRPLIKEKVLRYQELRAPSRHREMELRGRGGAVAPTPTR